jgi:hypothetical protein
MDFQDCITQCIEDASANLTYSHYVAVLESYPVPTEKEWRECVEEVQGAPGEDPENPWHCLGRYELRLSRLGFLTVLDFVAAEALAACKAAGWSQKELPALLMAHSEKAIPIDDIAKVVGQLVAKAKCN